MAVASYDSLAQWYGGWATWPPALFDYARHLLPASLDGQRVLDVACGQGRLSRELAAAGARVVGVDVSAEMIKQAMAEDGESVAIDYRHADVADIDAWWQGRSFDGAACEMALMDIEDLDGAISAIARVLRPGGWFVASMVHPCFPGDEDGLSSWPPEDGYSHEGHWTSADHNPRGVRIRIGSYHRTLSTYVNTLTRHALRIQAFAEPRDTLPQFLTIGCRRESANAD